MSMCIGVQAHAAALTTVFLNVIGYMATGCDLIGLQGDDAPLSNWPGCFLAVHTVKRHPGAWIGYGLHPSSIFESFAALLSHNYDGILWTECDSLFLGKPPEVIDDKFHAFIAGYCPPDWKCGSGPFLHPPMFATKQVIRKWCNQAKLMVANRQFGNGTTDVFSAMVCQAAGIQIVHAANTYSTNGLDMRLEVKLREARKAAQAGAWHIHGVKRLDHLRFILNETDELPSDTIF